MAKTPGQRLAEALETQGIKKSDLGRMLQARGLVKKSDNAYRGVQKWVKDGGWDSALRVAAAELLGLPPRYFFDDEPEPDDIYPSRPAYIAQHRSELDDDEIAWLRAQLRLGGDPGFEGWEVLLRAYNKARLSAARGASENLAAGAGAGHEPPPQPKRRKR